MWGDWCILSDKRQLILDRLGIREVVSRYCPEISINRDSRLPCPIHGGEGSNLKIYEKTNSYYCFTCKSAGDAIKFVAELFGLSYFDAMKKLDRDFNLHIMERHQVSDLEFLRSRKRQQAREGYREETERLEEEYKLKTAELKECLDGLHEDLIKMRGYIEAWERTGNEDILPLACFAYTRRAELEQETALLEVKMLICREEHEEALKQAERVLDGRLTAIERQVNVSDFKHN